jgi:hypothetical protein
MKKYILLASMIIVVLVISRCTNNKNSNEPIINKDKVSNEITTTQENNDFEKAKIKAEVEELESAFQENNNLKKPDIEEARDFETSLRNGSVIMIERDYSKEREVYNIGNLDKFLESFNNNKEGYVRIIKGMIEHDKFLVNKLDEYETDGKVIKHLVYDSYADKNKFIPGRSSYSPRMAKSSPDNSIRYSILQSKDTPDNMGATVISFDKSWIKN